MFIYIFSISVVEESHLKRQSSLLNTTDADTQTSFFRSDNPTSWYAVCVVRLLTFYIGIVCRES